MIDWMRLKSERVIGVSNVWLTLVKAFPVIGDWCVWKVGNGKHVQIGYDPWSGANNSWRLSYDLI